MTIFVTIFVTITATADCWVLLLVPPSHDLQHGKPFPVKGTVGNRAVTVRNVNDLAQRSKGTFGNQTEQLMAYKVAYGIPAPLPPSTT